MCRLQQSRNPKRRIEKPEEIGRNRNLSRTGLLAPSPVSFQAIPQGDIQILTVERGAVRWPCVPRHNRSALAVESKGDRAGHAAHGIFGIDIAADATFAPDNSDFHVLKLCASRVAKLASHGGLSLRDQRIVYRRRWLHRLCAGRLCCRVEALQARLVVSNRSAGAYGLRLRGSRCCCQKTKQCSVNDQTRVFSDVTQDYPHSAVLYPLVTRVGHLTYLRHKSS